MDELKVIDLDPYLAPYKKFYLNFEQIYKKKKESILSGSDITEFANGYLYFGFHYEDSLLIYREWAPNAFGIYLTGDFCGWDTSKYRLEPLTNGIWEIKIPIEQLNFEKYPEGIKVKSYNITAIGKHYRIPLYARYVVQDPETLDFSAFLLPPDKDTSYKWKNSSKDVLYSKLKRPLLIYEVHIGMSSEKEGITSYKEFTENILPYIKDLGYDAIQLMAIMEHPYYGSFGYQVSNFYAPSSRFGTPDDLKRLIDKAHGLGLLVIIDLVHSHSVKNTNEGINLFDGTEEQFFHKGDRGNHPLWDSKLFDYGKPGVIHFLLSNIKYWLTEFNFDGFRFDGITSMIYTHHGLGKIFSSYKDYFTSETDLDALIYLRLANELLHKVNTFSISIAEDVSGFPGMCLPVEFGGIGFDYRLGMGIPDYFEKTLSEIPDENWDLGQLCYTLTSKRPMEKVIGYAESHDQAMVGGKTIFFRLVDRAIYDKMHINDVDISIDRGIALHKMIRFIVLLLGGEGYLNFIGNEWGHPEWIDFPRKENNFSFFYARRLWFLAKDENLKFKYLLNFEKSMIKIFKNFHNFIPYNVSMLRVNEKNKIISFIRDSILYIFNFHPINSYTDYPVEIDLNDIFKKNFEQFDRSDKYSLKLIFSSDDKIFGGFDRVDKNIDYPIFKEADYSYIKCYLPNRTALAFKLK